jgi:hypothetical protein
VFRYDALDKNVPTAVMALRTSSKLGNEQMFCRTLVLHSKDAGIVRMMLKKLLIR